jgi:hypothetical protein
VPGHRHLAAAGFVVLLALPAGVPPVGDPAVEALDRSVRLLLTTNPAQRDSLGGFLSLLDALVLTAADAPSASACRAGLVRGRDAVKPGRMLQPATVDAIHACYRYTHGGEAFRLPPEVRTGEDPVGYCRERLADARVALLAARHEEAFGRMIEAAALVVTPVERESSGRATWLDLGREWWNALRALVLEAYGWLSTARSSSRA